MRKYHVIYGFRYQNNYKLSFTDVDGWPNIQGKKMLDYIKNLKNEKLIELYNSLPLTENILTNKNLPSEYKYIINLDNKTLEFYCKNNTPRAIFSFDNIRNNSLEICLSVMEKLDEPMQSMYDLFDNLAS